MKTCILFSFILIVSTALVRTNAQSHNSSWGKPDPYAVHLKRAVVYEKSGFLQKQTKDFKFTLSGVPYIKHITQVTVTDQYTNGKGGTATLTSGGPGFTDVEIRLTSQRGHGFNFIIDIYGR